MSSHKNKVINLTPHVLLTNTGVGFFVEKGYSIKKIQTADGSEQYGVRLAKVQPTSLQHMIRIGYLSRLELNRPEFSSVRPDLMDLSKLVIFGLMYRQFDRVLFDMLIESPLIKDWNRNNPLNIIDNKTRINDSYLNDVLSRNADQFKSMRKAITAPLLDKIASDKSLQADEKNAMIFLADRYLDYSRPFVWFILTQFSDSENHKDLIKQTRLHLDLYIRRSKIADYLTLLLMELAGSAETLNLIAFAERTQGRRADIRALQFDSVKRESMMKAMKKADTNLTLAWRVGDLHSYSIGTENKFELIIYNRDSAYAEIREKMEENLSSRKGVSLESFYKSMTAGNSEMGLLYLGYLQEECTKVGMRFTSRVSTEKDGIPSIILTVQF